MRPHRRPLLLVTAVLLVAAGRVANAGGIDDIGLGTVSVDGRAYPARIADEPAERAQGFQRVPVERIRSELIYFRFPGPSLPTFHMHNVRSPLTIAWIGADNRVIALTRMEPGRGGYRPPAPVTAALELDPRRVARLGLAVGVSVRLLAR